VIDEICGQLQLELQVEALKNLLCELCQHNRVSLSECLQLWDSNYLEEF
jgi:hypothetical protein